MSAFKLTTRVLEDTTKGAVPFSIVEINCFAVEIFSSDVSPNFAVIKALKVFAPAKVCLSIVTTPASVVFATGIITWSVTPLVAFKLPLPNLKV